MIFGPNDKRWYCCCGKIHVEKGALYIGYSTIVFGMITGLGIFIILPIGLLLVWGVRESQPKRIIPHLVLQIFYMILLVGVLGFAYVIMFTNGTIIYGKNNDETGFTFETQSGADVDTKNKRALKHAWTNFGVLIAAMAFLGIGIQAYIFWILLRAYKSIKMRVFSNSVIASEDS